MRSQLEKLKTEFLEYLEIEKNRSLLTIRNYDLYLSRFLNFAKRRGTNSPEKIDLDLVRNFRLWLNRQKDRKGQTLKLITQNYHVIAIRSFLKYLAKRDIKTLTAEKLELGRTPQRQVEFLESDDLEKLLKAPASTRNASSMRGGPKQQENDLISLRDQAILEVLFSTGLRVAELSSLKKTQVNLKKDEFAVRGKGQKLRIVFLSESAREALKKYLHKRTDNSPPLFTRHNHETSLEDNKPLTPRSVQRLIKKYALMTGISTHITPHTMRHTMATDLLANGADLRSVQEILGHSSITTTQIYTHITNRRLKEVYRKYHGKSLKNKSTIDKYNL